MLTNFQLETVHRLGLFYTICNLTFQSIYIYVVSPFLLVLTINIFRPETPITSPN